MTLSTYDNDDVTVKGDDGSADGKRIGVTNTDSLKVGVTTSALPTGAATEVTLASIDAGVPASLGQKTMANSMAVVISSDQSTLPVNDVGLPDTLGIKTAAGSTSIVLASDGVLPLPTGAATAANQATQITSLSSIDAGTPAALGQTTKANSMPVVLPSDYQVPAILQIVNSPIYEDMNASTGGVARGTSLTTTYTNVYSFTGSGLFYGLRITFQTLNVMQVRILIDGVDYLMGSTGLSLTDAAAAAIYNFATAVPTLGIELDGNSFTYQPPSPLKFTSSVVVKASVITGAAKQILAGFAVRSS